MGVQQIAVERLYLDPANPRIVRADNQREALQRIIDDQQTKLAVLAQDIVDNGLSPTDQWLVLPVEDEHAFVVLEGNRRLAAIKILTNPNVLGDLRVRPAFRKRFETMAQGFRPDSVSPVSCFVVGSREEAAPWIHQRHTGENEGRGIAAWSGLAAARFRGDSPGLQALDFVIEHGNLSNDEKERIENGRFPISTLDRLLDTPAVRATIGVEVSDRSLVTDLPAQAAAKILRKIVLDLNDQKINVTKLKTKQQQVDYVTGLTGDLPNLEGRTGQFRTVRENPNKTVDAGQSRDKPDDTQATRPARAKAAPVRRTLITADCPLNVTVPKIQRIETELRSLPLTTYPNAISTLLRVFLELSIDHYLGTKDIDITYENAGRDVPRKLRVKVNDMLKALEERDNIPRSELLGSRTMFASPNGPLNVDTLHGYIHNKHSGALADDLATAFDGARPLFEAIWK